MNIKKIFKVISALVAIAGVIAAIYFAIQKYTASKTPEYFDDNDFFECDNDIEIVEAKAEETPVAEKPVEEEAPIEEDPSLGKRPAKKKTTKKKAAKAE